MAWDFSTEPEFERKLEWMRAFVREQVWPLETLWTSWAGRACAGPPSRSRSRSSEQGLWAAHLDPELGGQGFGQVKLGLMHEILGSSPIAPLMFGNAAPDSGNSEILALARHARAEGALPVPAAGRRPEVRLQHDRARHAPAPIRRCCAPGRYATATTG